MRECPEAVEILSDLNPHDIWEAASWVLSTNKVVVKNDGVLKGFREMTGYKSGEVRKLFGLFAPAEKGGKTLEKLAEDAMQEMCEINGIPYENSEALKALLDVLQMCGTVGDIRNYIENNRIQQATDYYDSWKRNQEWTPEEEAEYEDYLFRQDHGGMSQAEYEAHREAWIQHIEETLEERDLNFDENEFYGNIADELALRQQNEIGNGNRRRETEQRSPGGDGILQDVGSSGSGTISGSSGEVLPSSPDVQSEGAAADGLGSGIRETDGIPGTIRQAVLSTASSGRRVESDLSNGSRYARSVPKTREEQRSAINRVIDFAKNVKDRVERAIIGGITKRQAKDFADNGIEVDDTWVHSFESSAVNHNQKRHGNQRIEDRTEQIAISQEDYARIPEILESYDRVSKSPNRSRSTGNEVIIFEKEFDDGYVYYLEEKRDRRKSLSFQTMYKKKKGTDSSDGLMPTASPSTPIAPSDNFNSNSDGKDNTLLSDKQEDKPESSLGERISEAEADVNVDPTDKQKEAGNYKKGHVQVGLFDVTIENPKGSTRRGKDADGKEWETTMTHTYGYIRGTKGVDGDHIDVYLSSDIDGWNGQNAFVVDQYNPDGSFDEHKVMLGFNDQQEAFDAYLSNYESGWEKGRRLDITAVPIEEFEKWIESSKRKTKAFAEYKGVKTGLSTEGYKSEFGNIIAEAFDKYIGFKEALTFEDKASEIDASAELLKPLSNKVAQMSLEEIAAVESDLDRLQDIVAENEDEGTSWLAAAFSDFVVSNTKLEERRKQLENEAALSSAVSTAVELGAHLPRKSKVNIQKFIDPREGSILGGVYHDSKRGMAIASDSRVLLMSSKDYDPSNADKIITPTGVKEGRYPDVSRVIPSEERFQTTEKADFGMLEALAEDALKRGKEEATKDREPQVAVKFGDGSYAVVDASVLRNFVRGARHVGATEIGLYKHDNTSWLVAKGEDGLSLMIGKAYDPAKQLYGISLGRERGNDYGERPELMELANEVAVGYEAARESKDVWLSSGSNARQLNLFDFDFTDENQSSKNGSASGSTLRAPKRVKTNLFDFDFTDEKESTDETPSNEKKKEVSKSSAIRSAEPERKQNLTIEDFGEKIAGARKDLLKDLSRDLGNVNVESLVKLPLGKAIKRPDFSKMVEKGAMTEDEALTAEALWQTVYSSRKPSTSRRNSRAIVAWAQETERKVRKLEEFINSDSARRREIMEETSHESYPNEQQEALDFRRIQEMNPDRRYDTPLFTPSIAWVNREVMNKTGMQLGDGTKIEFSVKPNLTFQYYDLYDASGRRMMKFPSTRDIKSAIDMVALATKIQNGDLDVEYPSHFFSTKGKDLIQEESGEFEVGWLQGYNYKGERFKDKESAEKRLSSLLAKGKTAKIYPVMRNTGYKSYQIKFNNPVNGEEIILEGEYPDRETAMQEIEDNSGSLSEKVNEVLSARQNLKKGAKDHFYITTVYENRKFYPAVCRNNVGGKLSPLENPVIKKFESREEANAWLKENKDRLESAYSEMMKQKRSFVYFEQTDRPRKGEDYRGGKDVTPEQFSDTFGFRGVQFGNWTNGADRQAALNEAYDALLDLAGVLGIDSRALSLNGELGLAFGSRGSGNANAHYESGEVVINLTKTRGAGSLAHEWWHALDNYLMRRAGVAKGFATEHLSGKSRMKSEIAGAISDLVDAVGRSDYAKRSSAQGEYWGRIIEETARLFGEWVVMKQEAIGDRNYFLSRGIEPSVIDMYREMTYASYLETCKLAGVDPVSRDEWKGRKESLGSFPYPTPEELKDLSEPMQRVIQALRSEGMEGLPVTEIAHEPQRGYKRAKEAAALPKMDARQLSLFDDDFIEEEDTDSDDSRQVDSAVDEYCEVFADMLKYDEDAMPEDVLDKIYDLREKLRQDLISYFRDKGNNEKDASDRAVEMIVTLQAQVSVANLSTNPLEGDKNTDSTKPEENQTSEKSDYENVVSHQTAGGDLLTYQHEGWLPELKDGEFSLMERRFSESGEFHFSGDAKIESADDVAYMMRNLEMKSIENTFGVLVKDGKTTIVHLGMGSYHISLANMSALKVADSVIGGADKIWFVHNHPSGNLRPSQQDENLHKTLSGMFGDRLQSSIIIDTLRGEYSEFGSGDNPVYRRPASAQGEEVESRVYRFDTMVYSKDFDFNSLSTIRGSRDVAQLLSGYRLGDGAKGGAIILDRASHVVANLPVPHDLTNEEGAEAIVNYTLRGGGSGVIIYGNKTMPAKDLRAFAERIKSKSGNAIQLVDMITFAGVDLKSAIDEGLMEPEVKYEKSEASAETNEDGVRYRDGEDIESTNKKFNQELELQINGELPKGHIYNMGMPSKILLSTGVPNLPIQMSATRLKVKSSEYGHDFNLEEVKNLVEELQHPMAIFSYGDKNKAQNLILGLESNGKQFIVGLSLNPIINERHLEINSIRNVFPKHNKEWLNWISQGKLLWVDKEKIQKLIDQQQTILADVDYLDLDNVSKIIKNFENPSLSDEKEKSLAWLSSASTNFPQEIDKQDFDSVAKVIKNFENPSLADENELKREWKGAYSDAEVSWENDPWSRAWGESLRTKKKQEKYANRMRKYMHDRVRQLSKILGTDIEVIDDNSGLEGRKRNAKGWYDVKNGKVVVVVGNHKSLMDIEATVLHEVVAHHGLRELFGEKFDSFLDAVYENAENGIKEQIDVLAIKNGWNRRIATEEYLAGLAERTDFENMNRTWWDKLKRLFMDFLRGCGFEADIELTDNELRYVLWMSYKNLQNPGAYSSYLGLAERVAKESELGVGNYALAPEDKPAIAAEGEGNAFASGQDDKEVAEDEMRFRDGDFTPRDSVMAAKIYEKMVARGSFQFQESLQDSMLGLKKLYEAIEQARWGAKGNFRIEDVAGYENAYLYENRMSSVNNGEQHQYFNEYMKPLLESIYKLCGKNELDRRILTDYLIAKHGLERNDYMRNRASAAGENTDRDFAGLCGLTGESDWHAAEDAAKDMVKDYEKDHDASLITELWDNIRKATGASLEKAYLSGLINEESYKKISGMYKYYIPLRGWEETTSDEVYGYVSGRNTPLAGSVVKKAEGRDSKADDPIATIALMADDSIRQGNRNIMKQRFLNFVHGNPSDLVSVQDLWLEYDDVNDVWKPVFADLTPDMTPEEVSQEIAKFEAKMEGLKKAEPDKYKRGRETDEIPYKVVQGNLKEHQVMVKRNGRSYVLTINGNPRAAQALNGLTNPNVEIGGVIGNVLKLGEYVNRNLSAFYTTRNPDFVVSNFLRDMIYSNCMTWVKENPRYALRFHKNCGKVNPAQLMKLISKHEKGKLDDSVYLERMFKEFILNGGETGYTSVKNIEGHKRTITSELKARGSAGRQAWRWLSEKLDLLNRSAENCARFAAFLTSREMGRTLDRSIYDAKEISVNFNKKGSGAKMLGAKGMDRNILSLAFNPKTYRNENDRAELLGQTGAYLGGGARIAYVFWNAGVQGMTNFGRSAKRHPLKALAGAASLFALGTVIPLLAQLLGGGDGDDDDKNAYYNLPEYIRRSNICFKAGEQWISIPLPIEYRSIYGLGELATGVISGNERYSDSELTMQLAGQISQIMPLDVLEGGGGISPFIPSAFKPLTEAYIMNKGWTGMPIYRQSDFNKNDPEWTKAYQSADQNLVDFTRWLNETTGGNDYKKGKIDINPAKLEYLLNGTFGGMISFPMKIRRDS